MKSLLLALLLSSTFAAAGEITIVWTHAKNSDTVGYFFESRFQSGLSSRIDIGMATQYRVSVDDDKEYVFFLIPYDRNKYEGKPSNIIKYKFSPKVDEPKILAPEIRIQHDRKTTK